MKRCAWCNKKFEVKHPSQRFCPKKGKSHKCKDRYHNHNNPRGKFAHLNKETMTDMEYYLASLHPFSSEALGQS